MIIINFIEMIFVSLIIYFSSDGFVNQYTNTLNIYSNNLSIIEVIMIILIFLYIVYLYVKEIPININNICFKNLSMIFIVFYGIAISIYRGERISFSMAMGYPFRLYILSFLLAFFMLQIPRNKKQLKNLIILMIFILTIKDIVGIFNYLFGDGYKFGFLNKVIFPFTDILSNNVLMFTYCFSMLMLKKFISKKSKIMYIFICAISTIVIIYSLKRTSMGLIIVSLSLILLFSNLKKKIASLIILIVILIFTAGYIAKDSNLNDNMILIRLSSLNFINNKDTDNPLLSDNGHLDDTLDAIDNIKENPIVGRGIYTDASRIRVVWQKNNNFFHNGFLMIWNQTGIIGLIIYIMFFYRIMNLAFKNYKYTESKIMIIFILMRIIEQFTLGALTALSSMIIITNIILVLYIKYLNIQGD